jgi:hypothetical protein
MPTMALCITIIHRRNLHAREEDKVVAALTEVKTVNILYCLVQTGFLSNVHPK